jgi:signal transduction histidine kinase
LSDPAHALAHLDERLAFESLLARFSSTFIALPADHIDSQMGHGLRQVLDFLQADHGGLWQFTDDGALLMTHTYVAPGLQPESRDDPGAALPWYAEQVQAGRLLRFSRLPDDLPAEAAEERECCLRSGVRSLLTLPLKVGDAVLGAVNLAFFRRHCDWPEETVQSLRLLADIFANALMRKRAEEAAAQLRERLARVSRVTAMGELAASIAHEVNQPLCAIATNSQAVQRMLSAGGFDLAELLDALQDVNRDALRASAVLARVRDFLRQAPSPRAPLDVNELVREVAALLRTDLSRRGVAATLELAEGLPLVPGDRVQLQQVLLNLMANAAEAMARVHRPERRLGVRTSSSACGIAVEVCDAGTGLTPAAAARAFDAFFTTKPGGLGMGLAICKSIVQAHGGRIEARPNAGAGTTFQFTLPLPAGVEL